MLAYDVVHDIPLTTVHNYLFSLPEDQRIQFSSRNLVSEMYEEYFLPYLPREYKNKCTESHEDPASTVGFKRGFDAWAAMYKGQLHGVDWVCRMLLDDCSGVMDDPFEFLQLVRWLFAGINPNLQAGENKINLLVKAPGR